MGKKMKQKQRRDLVFGIVLVVSALSTISLLDKWIWNFLFFFGGLYFICKAFDLI